MRRPAWSVCIAALCLASLASAAVAWDVTYDGRVLPTMPVLGSSVWQANPQNDIAGSGFVDGAFALVDQRTDATAQFYREGDYLPQGTDVTIETRVKVTSAYTPYDYSYAVGFGATAYSGSAFVGLWSDRIGTRYDSANQDIYYAVDMTQFHTIRMAVDSSAQSYEVWLDGAEVFSGRTCSQSGAGVYFGSSKNTADTGESYWDYVSYSKAFLPIPEPSSPLALGSSILMFVGLAARRRSMKR